MLNPGTMRFWVAIGVSAGLLSGCGLKGDPIPYLEAVRREKAKAAAADGKDEPAPLAPAAAPERKR